MNLPLPQCLHTDKPTGDHNAGLWYDKFFNGWADGLDKVPDGNKSDWIKAVTGHPIGDTKQLEETQTRLQGLVHTRDGHLLYFKTDGRFVTGLGRAHPVENGFAWHHTLGVPYLPGSSVKGILRAWARESDISRNEIQRILGGPSTAGNVVVLDALPTKPVQLEADVMTPHYGKYYQDQNASTPPADWHNPTPIPFLTVAKTQPFTFALLPRRAGHTQDQDDCHTAAQWLNDALIWLGAGAKTAVGYGRFEADTDASEAAAEAASEQRAAREHDAALRERLQGLSPLAQALAREIDEQHWESDKNAFAQNGVIEGWLDRLEADPQADAIQSLGQLLRIHFRNLLEDPGKVSGKKHMPKFNERQRSIAHRFNKLSSVDHHSDSV